MSETLRHKRLVRQIYRTIYLHRNKIARTLKTIQVIGVHTTLTDLMLTFCQQTSQQRTPVLIFHKVV